MEGAGLPLLLLLLVVVVVVPLMLMLLLQRRFGRARWLSRGWALG
jgi:Na+/glutamate symporter